MFRMGDFYEMFHQDAETAAPILNIALTSRNKKSADDTKMCGVPHHSIAGPIGKLLAAGYKVAICDQIEDPKEAKGIVKRAVTRVLSPGMVFDPETLDQTQSNFLASFDNGSVSFLDPSTGEACYFKISSEEEKSQVLGLMSPVEWVLSSNQKSAYLKSNQKVFVHLTSFDFETAQGQESQLPESASRLLAYAKAMQGEDQLKTLRPFEERFLNRHLEMSTNTLNQLELIQSYRGESRGSLFHALHQTQTSGGARLLKTWIRFPLAEQNEIEERLNQVEFWMSRPEDLKNLRRCLGEMGDIERRLGKVSHPNCSGRDLLSLRDSLEKGLELSQYLPDRKMEGAALDFCMSLVQLLSKNLNEDLPISVREGGLIQKGLRDDLDELIDLSENAEGKLLQMEEREKSRTGIGSLKIRYNSVFGYYIEVTKTHSEKVPSDYIRKQTLTNAERYTTPELDLLEQKVLSAKAKRADLEYQIFIGLKKQVLRGAVELLHLAKVWSELDVLTSFSWTAIGGRYVRPRFSKEARLKLVDSRHPVVEQEMKTRFVPNTIELDPSGCLLLTGPNMAGKSTLMRQVAVSVILAQMGSFVPASFAELPLFQKIYTRIGASDFLSEGLSTFMVEMTETAEILKGANNKSLVILDEIGRGTSTYDGMSLAQSILEYLVLQNKPMVFFATHYHELTHLERMLPQVKNAHMAISEKRGEIEFLHTLRLGPANKSYGIHVARLAGLPAAVTQRAKSVLDRLESFQSPNSSNQLSLADQTIVSQGPSTPPELEELIEKIRSLSLQQMTPLEAMNQIAQWQQKLS